MATKKFTNVTLTVDAAKESICVGKPIGGKLTMKDKGMDFTFEEQPDTEWLNVSERKWMPVKVADGFRVTRNKNTGDCRITFTLEKEKAKTMTSRSIAEKVTLFEEMILKYSKK